MGKRAPRAAAAALVLGLCALVVVGPAAASFVVPEGVTDLSISAVGGAGGTGGDFYLPNGAGGDFTVTS